MPNKYKIILKNPNNLIADCIYSKISNIKYEDRIFLINNTNKYILDHIMLPIYEKKDIEEIIYNYGIQNAILHFVLNKRYYNKIILQWTLISRSKWLVNYLRTPQNLRKNWIK